MTTMTRAELLAELIRERFGAPPLPPAQHAGPTGTRRKAPQHDPDVSPKAKP